MDDKDQGEEGCGGHGPHVGYVALAWAQLIKVILERLEANKEDNRGVEDALSLGKRELLQVEDFSHLANIIKLW